MIGHAASCSPSYWLMSEQSAQLWTVGTVSGSTPKSDHIGGSASVLPDLPYHSA